MKRDTINFLGIFVGLIAYLPFIVWGSSSIYYVHSDHLGTPQKLTDGSGQVVWSAEYEPFGEATVDGDPDGDGNIIEFNLRFPGQYYDKYTGANYNYYRDYDPSIGRYIQSDPIGLRGGLNTYSYVLGNPLIYVDPFGLVNLQIPGASGETSVHANPGRKVTPPSTRSEHPPSHIHLGSNEGPRVSTEAFEPLTPEDGRRMSNKQKKFCKNLSEGQRNLIRSRQYNVFNYGTKLLQMLSGPTMLSPYAYCQSDPGSCIDMLDDL